MKTEMHRAGVFLGAVLLLFVPNGWAATNAPISLDANTLRDRLFDAGSAAALSRAPIQATVLHLMDEAMRRNPGLLSAPDAAAVMQRAINSMTNDFGNSPQVTLQDYSSLALPYLEKELRNRLPPNTVNDVMTGWSIVVVAEQQGLFSTIYSNLTTALPTGTIFSDVENTASGIQALYRQSASAAATLALPERIRTSTDPAFHDAALQVMGQLTSIGAADTLETIAQKVPAFRNSKLVQELVQGLRTAGQVVTDINTAMKEANNVLTDVHQTVKDGAAVLGQLANAQDVLRSLANGSLLADAQKVAGDVSSVIDDSINTAQPLINLTSTLIKLGGNSKLAQEVVTVGGAAIKVAKAVKGVFDGIQAAKGLFSIGASFAEGGPIGGLISAGLDIFSTFGGGLLGGSNPDQAVLDEINAVRQDIAALRQDMDARFNRVDAALTNIMGKLDYNLGAITNGFQYVENNLAQIRGNLLDLQGQVHRLEGQTYSWIQALGDRNLNLALNIGLGYQARYGIPLTYDQGNQNFITYEGTFYTWAFNNSSDALSEPTSGDYSVYPGLYSQLGGTNAPENNVAYINSFIGNRLLSQTPFNGVLANPRVWSVAANAYLQLCLENPAWFRKMPNTKHLDDIIGVGNNLNTFLTRLVVSGTNVPNTNLWLAVCQGYRSEVQSFTNAIQASLDQYNRTNGFPAGFNPFTNQFLSLVTASGTNMVDGYYTVASVVYVSAMACSPTPDGMPIYFLDQNALRRLDTNGMITTLAGSADAAYQDGPNARFNRPQGLAVGLDGSVYVADTGNHAIRVYHGSTGLVTLAGYAAGTNNTVPFAGAVDGTGGLARFNGPRGLLIDRDGNLLVADRMNHAIRSVTPSGLVTTFAGTLGQGGLRDGLTDIAAHAVSGGSTAVAQFWAPDRLAMDTNGLIYVISPTSPVMRTIDTNGVVHTSRASVPGWLLPEALSGNPTSRPSQIFSSSVAAIAAGGGSYPWIQQTAFCLALRGDSNITAWGDNWAGQLNVPVGVSNVVAVAAGQRDGIALRADGTVAVWGDPSYGELVTAGLSNVVAVAAGGDFLYALRSDNTITGWGYNGQGQLNVPVGLSNVTAVAAGSFHAIALRADGTVAAWGDNAYGECNVPPGLSNVVAVAAGDDYSVALRSDTTVAAWGYNNIGQCNVPSGLSDVVAVAAGEAHVVALRADGTVTAWGYNNSGQCNVPADLSAAVAVAAGGTHSIALRRDGTVAQWGLDIGAIPIAVPQQTLDTPGANAVLQQFTAGVTTPDGRVLAADGFGLRLFDYSDRIQRQAAGYLYNDLANSGGTLNQAANSLKAWHLLLQNLATYALTEAVGNDDALHALLFGSPALVDTDYAATFLNGLVQKADWRPTHLDMGTTALQQADLLQSHIQSAVVQMFQQTNSANLPLITDTLTRLNLLRATHDLPVPAPALSFGVSTNRTIQVLVNGYPYVDYGLQSSPDLATWATNASVIRDGESMTFDTRETSARFYRGVQLP